MKKLVTRYISLHWQVVVFESCAIFLLVMLFAYTLYSIYHTGLSKSLDQIETFGVVLSVILLSKIATRQIIHTELVVENCRASSLTMNAHFLLTVINDMRNKTYYIQGALLDTQQARTTEANMLIEFIHDIEKDYQALKDKEVHQHLSGSTLVLIWDMSANIEGLKALGRVLTKPEILNLPSLSPDVLLNIFRGATSFSQGHPSLSLEKILTALEKIENEVRDLRSSIDLPKKLKEIYEKI